MTASISNPLFLTITSLSNYLYQTMIPVTNPLFRTMASLLNPFFKKMATSSDSICQKEKRWPHCRIHSFRKRHLFSWIHSFRQWHLYQILSVKRWHLLLNPFFLRMSTSSDSICQKDGLIFESTLLKRWHLIESIFSDDDWKCYFLSADFRT